MPIIQSAEAAHHARRRQESRAQKNPDIYLAHRQKKEKAKPTNAKREIREMCFYFIFLAVFTFATLDGKNDQARFYFSDNLREQLTRVEFPFYASHVEKTFDKMATIADVWFYLTAPLFNVLYTAGSFDGDDNYNISTVGGSALNEPGYINGQCRILGSIRLGQARVKRQPCSTPTNLRPGNTLAGTPASWKCYPPFSKEVEDLTPFGFPRPLFRPRLYPTEPGFKSPLTSASYTAPAFSVLLPNIDPRRFPTAASAAALNVSALNATSAFSGGAGRVRDVQETLRAMQRFKFLDVATRVLFIDINVYNPVLDHVCLVRLSVETMATGGLTTFVEMNTLRLYEYFTADDYLRLGAELVTMLFVIAYSVVEVKTMLGEGFLTYLKQASNAPHALNLILFYWVCALKLSAVLALPSRVRADSSSYISFRASMNLFMQAQDMNAFNAFLSWAKVFKYLSFAPKFRILLDTLKNAGGKLGGFSVVIAIVFYGWSLAFMLVFGTRLYGYRNLSTSFYALISAALGDFDFEELREVNPVMAPLMFGLFIVLVVFVVLNMFIAIISDAFSETKAEIERQRDVGLSELGVEIYEFFLHGLVFRIPLLGGVLEAAYDRANAITHKLTHQLMAQANTVMGGSGGGVGMGAGGDEVMEMDMEAGGGGGKRGGNPSQVVPISGGSVATAGAVGFMQSSPAAAGAGAGVGMGGASSAAVLDRLSAVESSQAAMARQQEYVTQLLHSNAQLLRRLAELSGGGGSGEGRGEPLPPPPTMPSAAAGGSGGSSNQQQRRLVSKRSATGGGLVMSSNGGLPGSPLV